MTEAVAYLQQHPRYGDALSLRQISDRDKKRGWTETPLYHAEALAAKDEKIAELERECDTLSGLVRGWHYLAVGPDEMGDYHTQKQLIKLSEPYASPALKALKEKNDDA